MQFGSFSTSIASEKVDVLRYLCSIAPENKDSDFTWKDFQARNNNELVAILELC